MACSHKLRYLIIDEKCCTFKYVAEAVGLILFIFFLVLQTGK